MTRDATIWKEAAEVIASHHSAVDAIAECLERAKSAAPVAADPPSLVALVQEWQAAHAEWLRVQGEPLLVQEGWARYQEKKADLLTWTPAQAEPGKVCGAPTPDRSGRSCDKPKGHDGDHWTYGGHTLTWPAQAEPAASSPAAPEVGCEVIKAGHPDVRVTLTDHPLTAPEAMPEIREGDEVTHVDVATVVAVDNALIETSDGQGIALEDVTSVRRNGEVIWSRP